MAVSESVPCPACGHSVLVSRQRCGERIVCSRCYRSATLTLVGPAGQQRLLLLTNDVAQAARVPRAPARPPAIPTPPKRNVEHAPRQPQSRAQPQSATASPRAPEPGPQAVPVAATPPRHAKPATKSGQKSTVLIVGLVLGTGALLGTIVAAFLLGEAFNARQGQGDHRPDEPVAESKQPGPAVADEGKVKPPNSSERDSPPRPPASAELTTPDIVSQCESSVCHIKTPIGTGTGFVVGPGLIATNEHVIGIADPGKISIKFPAQHNATFDHVSIAFAVLKTDLLILRVPGLPPGYRALQPARLMDLQKGEKLVVIGNPKGIDSVVSEGTCGSVKKVDNADFLLLSAPINPGNSGGPALTRHARVAGVVTLKRADAEGIGYAIPGDVLTQALLDLQRFSEADKNVHTWLAKQAGAKLWSGCAIAVQLMIQPLDPRIRGRTLEIFDEISHDAQTRLDALRRGNPSRVDLDDVEKLADCYHRLSQQARSPSLSEDAVKAVYREARGLHDGMETRLGSMDGLDAEDFVKGITQALQGRP